MSVWARCGLAVVALAAIGWRSTTFISTWRAPDARPLSFTKGDTVVAMVMAPNLSTRLGAEQVLAIELTRRGLRGLPSNTLIPEADVKDKDKAKALVEKSGAVGVVVMRVTGRDKEVSSSTSVYTTANYGGFWGGYYGWGWGMVYDPSYLRTDTILGVETLVYDLRQDKLVWAGQSQSTNPKSVESFIKELVARAAAEMKKQGLIRAAK
jgi:hypothetical protein